MKKLFVLLFACTLVGCTSPTEPKEMVNTVNTIAVVNIYGEDAQSATVEYTATAAEQIPVVYVDVYTVHGTYHYTGKQTVSKDSVNGAISYFFASAVAHDSVLLVSEWGTNKTSLRLQ